MSHNKAILIILDGFGIGGASPFNAIENARMPFYRELMKKYPHSELLTHGEAVGLPEGVMGNSEVGHMTMGAGRIIYQDLTRISRAIRTGEFFENPVLKKTIQAGSENTGRVHLMGLLSDGGVHSHMDHLLSLLDLCVRMKVPHVSCHLFLDGRDTPPNSAPQYLQKLLTHPAFAHLNPTTPSSPSQGTTRAEIASLMGRYYAMDRDQRWERIQAAYHALTGQMPELSTPEQPFPQALEVLEHAYSRGKTDDFIEPILFSKQAAMKSGDSVIFFNYRSDRAREISQALTQPEFSGFQRTVECKLSAFAGLTTYDTKLKHVGVAFAPQNLSHLFGQWLESKKLTQLRIAETEKYAHVTFFFNGGREQPFLGEDRILVPSPKDVPTYDLKPEMSAFEVARLASERIQAAQYDFMLMNFANADMVGHTGNYEASVKAVEALDQCLSQVIGAAERSGYHVLLTADHGNAEEMRDCQGRLHTQHTLNPVPAIWVAPQTANAPKKFRTRLKDGNLGDIMPTLCDLMKLDVPNEVTGKSLIPQSG
ncbi:MAG: 2,3-bisphosphoglycerate-independent phosphoglycerate mutase [Bdellovibrionia bacterium]